MDEGQPRRDLIGIGGSAGGLPALLELLEGFQPESPASVFVVLHRAREAGHLDQAARHAGLL